MTERGSSRSDPFEGVHQTARTWLRTVAQQLGTEDEVYAHRVLRAWLHTVRDQLSVDVAAHVAAQLPVLLRGIFFEGWAPRRVPVEHDAEQFLVTVGQEARLSLPQAAAAAAAVTRAIEELTSPDLVAHVLTPLPTPLRAVLAPGAPVLVPAEAAGPEPAEMFAEEPAMPAPRWRRSNASCRWSPTRSGRWLPTSTSGPRTSRSRSAPWRPPGGRTRSS